DVTGFGTTGRVIFGATVKLMEEKDGREVTYTIVGDDEADIKVSKISVNSPVARALIGKEIDDVALVQTPGGEHEYEIVAVRYD
ncbi:MAG: GreA/GreB family elongation factor, partial [Gammaproteobacteria bacterium]|nr:GreA/GreB family elongation factor [Gammaproteobacteria bacterium]